MYLSEVPGMLRASHCEYIVTKYGREMSAHYYMSH